MSAFNRRIFLKHSTLAAAATSAGMPLLAWAEDAGLRQAAEAVYIWGYPLVGFERYWKLGADAGYELNRFAVSSDLATPADKVAGPNVDTLYGFSFLDLAAEPLVLHVPETNDRYYSVQLIDAYQNVFDYVGRRTTGTHEGRYLLAGPNWKGKAPAGIVRIDAPTSRLLALTRVLVRSRADLAEARAVQDQLTLEPLSREGQEAAKPRTAVAAFNVFPVLDIASAGPKYFDELGEALALNPPPARELAPQSQFAQIGVGPGKKPGESSNAPVLAEAAAAANKRIRSTDLGVLVNGWRVNLGIRPFNADPLERAVNNYYGPGAHVAEEGLYFGQRADGTGAPLSGAARYRLHFAGGQLPPVDAFWSLILYGPDFALVENPIHRYSISDRTEGLKLGADGSLEVLIQTEPAESATANWLPAPAGGYSLILRTYQPRPQILNRSWKPPVLERLG